MKFIYSLLTVLFMAVASCSAPRSNPALDRADALIESAPDSALTILSAIDPDSLTGQALKARHALLLSMALDKNYIDTTNFDVLRPAIDYYPRHGSPDEKLRTYYYEGRIYQNRGDRDSALNSFVKAINLAPLCHDSMVIARAYEWQAQIYEDFFDYAGSTENQLIAADIYRQLRYEEYEFDCLMNAYENLVVLRDREKADSVLRILGSFNNINDTEYQNLLHAQLIHAIQFGSKNDIDSILHTHSNLSGIDINVILSYAYAYYKSGKIKEAKTMLDIADASGCGYDTLRFQSIAVRVYQEMGDYKNAFSLLLDFNHKNDSIHSLRFIRESQLMEHKHRIELKAQIDAQRKKRIIWSCIGGLLVLSAGIIILLLLLRSNRIRKDLAHQRARTAELENEKLKTENINITLRAENLAHRVEMLESESESLKALIESQDELPPEVEHVIQERIEMLNALLAGYITANDQYETPYDTWVKSLTDDTEAFMNTNRLAFQASHPRFIRYFEDHDLTTDEINYVCLYALGLRGKEVGNYIKKPGHVNISSTIRRKLGIDRHETNISIYVRKLLQNFKSSH